MHVEVRTKHPSHRFRQWVRRSLPDCGTAAWHGLRIAAMIFFRYHGSRDARWDGWRPAEARDSNAVRALHGEKNDLAVVDPRAVTKPPYRALLQRPGLLR